jgi:hypothetical protein
VKEARIYATDGILLSIIPRECFICTFYFFLLLFFDLMWTSVMCIIRRAKPTHSLRAWFRLVAFLWFVKS